jgi:hypothetical protein
MLGLWDSPFIPMTLQVTGTMDVGQASVWPEETLMPHVHWEPGGQVSPIEETMILLSYMYAKGIYSLGAWLYNEQN